ncbi:MAG: hypothetical protein U0M06_14265, partial [Clostridia bacterium]|nr:hypothetical protein [Clostridia bacterium]
YNYFTSGGGIMEIASSLGIIVTVISMIICPIIAHNKGRSAFGWFFGGLLLGGIGIIIVSCLSPKN